MRGARVQQRLLLSAASMPVKCWHSFFVLRYIRKFGQQSVFEKLSSNVVRDAHSQFDILMGIVQAHILSFGVPADAEDAGSIATSVRANLSRSIFEFNCLSMCLMAWSNCTLKPKRLKLKQNAAEQPQRAPAPPGQRHHLPSLACSLFTSKNPGKRPAVIRRLWHPQLTLETTMRRCSTTSWSCPNSCSDVLWSGCPLTESQPSRDGLMPVSTKRFSIQRHLDVLCRAMR